MKWYIVTIVVNTGRTKMNKRCSTCYYWIDEICRQPDSSFLNKKMLAFGVCGNWTPDYTNYQEDEDGDSRTEIKDKK